MKVCDIHSSQTTFKMLGHITFSLMRTDVLYHIYGLYANLHTLWVVLAYSPANALPQPENCAWNIWNFSCTWGFSLRASCWHSQNDKFSQADITSSFRANILFPTVDSEQCSRTMPNNFKVHAYSQNVAFYIQIKYKMLNFKRTERFGRHLLLQFFLHSTFSFQYWYTSKFLSFSASSNVLASTWCIHGMLTIYLIFPPISPKVHDMFSYFCWHTCFQSCNSPLESFILMSSIVVSKYRVQERFLNASFLDKNLQSLSNWSYKIVIWSLRDALRALLRLDIS